MQGSVFFELHQIAIERQGPRASFVYSALLTDGSAWNELQSIVMRAYTAAVQDRAVDDVAAEIDIAEDAALTQWMTRWKYPPTWFRLTAIVVMIFLTYLTRPTFEIPAPIAVTPPLIDPHATNRRIAEGILDNAWQAVRNAYLDTLYIDVDQRKRRFDHYQWAVEWQVNGESFEKIATRARNARGSDTSPTAQAVSEAVHKALDRIEVEPRTKASS